LLTDAISRSWACRFGNFFNHVDTFQEDAFSYLTSAGMPTTKTLRAKEDMKAENAALAEIESESEDEGVNGGEEGG
jgi:tRNA pseudouridine38-40 synthase